MSTPNRTFETDPFAEPLSPLPAAPEGDGAKPKKPEAVEPQAGAMEPEVELPAEEELVSFTAVETELELSGGRDATLPRWKFWRRPSRRDQQLETLRQGASEMVGLMRSIRDHLELERGERQGLHETLSPLPVAVESLRSISEHQADTGRVLGELRTTIERRAQKDAILLNSLNRIGDTMSNVDETFGQMDQTLSGLNQSNQRSVETMQKLGERVTDSDRFMNETFARLRDSEREFTDHVSKASRRSSFAMLAVCSILLLAVMAVGFMFKENRELLFAVQNNGALVVQVPSRSPEAIAILEELKQVDDGIDEPDREMVRAGAAAPQLSSHEPLPASFVQGRAPRGDR